MDAASLEEREIIGSFFCRNPQGRTKGKTMQKLTRTCSNDSLPRDIFIVFSMLSIISTTLLYYSVQYALHH